MSHHRPPLRWAALAFGIGLLLFPTSARASNWEGFGEFAVFVVLSTVLLSSVFGLLILIPVAILGRRSAPLTPWKRTVAVLGIVFASLCTAWNLMVSLVLFTMLSAVSDLSSTGDQPGVVLLFSLLVAVVPLSTSVLAIIFSAKLYSRNKTVLPPQANHHGVYPSSFR